VKSSQSHSRQGSCPTKTCWDLDSASRECKVKEEKDCFSLLCSFDKMVVVFGEALFGPFDDTREWETGDGFMVPEFDSVTKKWAAKCKLGECGMTSIINQDQTTINFETTVALGPKYNSVGGVKIAFMPSGSIKFICQYPTSIQATSTTFNVQKAEANESTFGVGSLNKGFKVASYADSEYSTPAEQFYIGNAIFIDITWSVTSASSVKFVVMDCSTKIMDYPVEIIRDTCFSSNLKAKMWKKQTDKAVQTSSRFQYEAFVTRARLTEVTKLTCHVQLCIDKCAELDHGSHPARPCPESDAYHYKRFGK
jgi:hypothetical protein